MVVTNETTNLLLSLGLTEYEAKAYVALVAIAPASAYELAKHAGMPTSKIYETLSRLTEKGLAIPLAEGEERGRRFGALNPDDFLSQKKQEVSDATQKLGPMLKSITPPEEVGYIWPMDTTQEVTNRAQKLIANAVDTALVSIWPQELAVLKHELSVAVDRGVQIAIVHFGKPETSVGATFHHPVEHDIAREKGGRGLTMVVDSQEAMMATFLDSGAVQGAWSRNKAFVCATDDYIRHDIYITKVTALMGKKMRKRFGENYEKLRDVFLAADKV